MKDYRQLIKELPSKTLVCAFGDFDPPTTAHELMVKTVNRLAEQKNTDHVIYASTKDSLIQEEKKEQYLKLVFPKTKFKFVNESKINNLIEELSKKYTKIVIVSGSEQVAQLKKLVKENNIQIIPITEKNPDSGYAKMKQLATKGLYEEFKKKLPSTIRELDSRRMMNDVRHGLGLEPIKEQLVLVKDELREQYFRKEIFNEGDLVESNGQQFTIVKRGSNHLLLKEESGKLVSKWIQDVKPLEEKEMNESALNPKDPHGDYKAKSKALQDLSMNKDVDQAHVTQRKLDLDKEYAKHTPVKEGVIQQNGTDKLEPSTSDTGAKQDTKEKIKGKTKGFLTFYNYNMKESKLDGDDAIKIATSKSDEDKDGESDSDAIEQMLTTYDPSETGHTLVPGENPKGSHHLRRMKAKYHLGETTALDNFRAAAAEREKKHDDIEQKRKEALKKQKENMSDAINRLDAQINKEEVKEPTGSLKDACWKGYTAVGMKDKNGKKVPNCVPVKEDLEEAKNKLEVCPECGEHECKCGEERPGVGTDSTMSMDPFFKEELTEEEINDIVESATDEDIEDLYEEHELELVYEDTGEIVEAHPEESKLDLMEVLSRQERMKGKIRLRKTAAKRGRSTKIALKRYSDVKTINKRARRLAIKLMKKRMLRGRNPAKVSVGEKERVEKAIAQRKTTVDRIAQKLVTRVRKVEKSRMSHGKVTKGAMPSVF